MSRLIRVRVGRPPGPPVDPPGGTELLSSIATGNDGIGWTFDGSYQCGQYCNGDWFVVGPVTVASITPGWNGSDHGSQLNSEQSKGQGFRSIDTDFAWYSAAKNVGASLPATIPVGSSLISTETGPWASSNRSFVYGLRVLTVVDAAPPAGSFRPSYAGTDKTHYWREADLDYEFLPSLASVASAPAMSTAVSSSSGVWFSPYTDGVACRNVHPRSAMPAYGRDLAGRIGRDALMLCLDFTNAEKRDLLVNLVQMGIDFYGVTLSGGTSRPGWEPNGGHAQGRKLPIVIAGAALNSADLAGRAANPSVWFGEDDQTFYVSQADVDRTLNSGDYTSGMLGMPEWGIRHRSDPARDNPSPTTSYRRGETGATFPAITLSARLMGLKGAWNHDPLFDYADRYQGLGTIGAAWPDLVAGWQLDPSQFNFHSSPFDEDMWNTYRSTV